MKKIILLALAFFLAACDTMPVAPPAPTTVYEKIPDSLLVKCYISPPPQADTYVLKSAEDKLDIMTKYSTKLLGDLDVCNIRLGEVRLANDKKDKLFNQGSGSK